MKSKHKKILSIFLILCLSLTMVMGNMIGAFALQNGAFINYSHDFDDNVVVGRPYYLHDIEAMGSDGEGSRFNIFVEIKNVEIKSVSTSDGAVVTNNFTEYVEVKQDQDSSFYIETKNCADVVATITHKTAEINATGEVVESDVTATLDYNFKITEEPLYNVHIYCEDNVIVPGMTTQLQIPEVYDENISVIWKVKENNLVDKVSFLTESGANNVVNLNTETGLINHSNGYFTICAEAYDRDNLISKDEFALFISDRLHIIEVDGFDSNLDVDQSMVVTPRLFYNSLDENYNYSHVEIKDIKSWVIAESNDNAQGRIAITENKDGTYTITRNSDWYIGLLFECYFEENSSASRHYTLESKRTVIEPGIDGVEMTATKLLNSANGGLIQLKDNIILTETVTINDEKEYVLDCDGYFVSKVEALFKKDAIPMEELLTSKEPVATVNITGNPNDNLYWSTYASYKEVFNSSEKKYLLVENGKTEGECENPLDQYSSSAFVNVYALSADELEGCLMDMNEDLMAYLTEQGRADTIWPTGSFAHDLKLIEKQYLDAVKTLTKTSNLGMYSGNKKSFLNNLKIKFTQDETKNFEEFGLMVDSKNVELDKLAVFTRGKVVGIVSADITTKQKDNQALQLDWVPEVGKTKRVTFFVDVIPTTSSGITYNKLNIEVIKY